MFKKVLLIAVIMTFVFSSFSLAAISETKKPASGSIFNITIGVFKTPNDMAREYVFSGPKETMYLAIHTFRGMKERPKILSSYIIGVVERFVLVSYEENGEIKFTVGSFYTFLAEHISEDLKENDWDCFEKTMREVLEQKGFSNIEFMHVAKAKK